MKKALLLTLAICLIAMPAFANIFDDAVTYVKERPAKVGVSYSFDDHSIVASVGTALVKDLYPNVDIDLLVSGSDKDIFNNDDKIVSLGASYNVKLGENSKVSLGISAGTKRFESFKNSEIGEGKLLVSGLYSWRF